MFGGGCLGDVISAVALNFISLHAGLHNSILTSTSSISHSRPCNSPVNRHGASTVFYTIILSAHSPSKYTKRNTT